MLRRSMIAVSLACAAAAFSGPVVSHGAMRAVRALHPAMALESDIGTGKAPTTLEVCRSALGSLARPMS